MDKFQVMLMPAALKFYRSCPLELAQQLNRCFRDLEKNPFFGHSIKLLRGPGKRYRYKVGKYRVIYFVDKDAKNAVVTLISIRSSAYRNFA